MAVGRVNVGGKQSKTVTVLENTKLPNDYGSRDFLFTPDYIYTMDKSGSDTVIRKHDIVTNEKLFETTITARGPVALCAIENDLDTLFVICSASADYTYFYVYEIDTTTGSDTFLVKVVDDAFGNMRDCGSFTREHYLYTFCGKSMYVTDLQTWESTEIRGLLKNNATQLMQIKSDSKGYIASHGTLPSYIQEFLVSGTTVEIIATHTIDYITESASMTDDGKIFIICSENTNKTQDGLLLDLTTMQVINNYKFSRSNTTNGSFKNYIIVADAGCSVPADSNFTWIPSLKLIDTSKDYLMANDIQLFSTGDNYGGTADLGMYVKPYKLGNKLYCITKIADSRLYKTVLQIG